jgi:hypothetical protein
MDATHPIADHRSTSTPRFCQPRFASQAVRHNLSVRAILVGLLVLANPLAHAGRYELIKGQGVEVCEAYEKNLNSFEPHEPMLCDRPVSPEVTDMQKPEWERLNFDQNQTLIVSVDQLLRPNYFAKPEMIIPTLRKNVELDNYRYQLMMADIDNDGKTEPVLRFVESCWQGSTRLGGAAL